MPLLDQFPQNPSQSGLEHLNKKINICLYFLQIFVVHFFIWSLNWEPGSIPSPPKKFHSPISIYFFQDLWQIYYVRRFGVIWGSLTYFHLLFALQKEHQTNRLVGKACIMSALWHTLFSSLSVHVCSGTVVPWLSQSTCVRFQKRDVPSWDRGRWHSCLEQWMWNMSREMKWLL